MTNIRSNAIAIGNNAGRDTLGQYSIAIGYYANRSGSDYYNTLVINATSEQGIEAKRSNSCYINPIRNSDQSFMLLYNTSTKEVTYTNKPSVVAVDNVIVNNYLRRNHWIQSEEGVERLHFEYHARTMHNCPSNSEHFFKEDLSV